MQAVMSRVHHIVTQGGGGGGASAGAGAAVGGGGGGGNPAAASPTSSSTPGRNAPTSPVAASSAAAAAMEKQVAPAPAMVKEIQLAVERMQYATLLGERKKAVAAMHELVTTFTTNEQPEQRTALGNAAVPVVLQALISDPRDTELMEAMIEFLQDVVSKSPSTGMRLLEPMGKNSGSLNVLGAPTSGMQILLQLLQDPSPWIRGPAVTLVKCLQEAQPKEFCTSVLECKEGLRRLLEVVEDKREHIRDAALLVLVKLTEKEKNVQQFLAFEEGFTRLFQIMEAEGLTEGVSVVSDCLQIVNNMVRDNLMTQTLLRELPYLNTHLPSLLAIVATSTDDGTAATKTTQRKRTLKLGLQLVRFLVGELYEGIAESKLDELSKREKTRKQAELASIQSFVGRQSELMGAIGELACTENEELADIQLQALDLLHLLALSNGGNQVILVNLHTMPSNRSLLSVLAALDVTEDETPVAAAATALLDLLFRSNETAKLAIFQHLNAPPPMDAESGPPPIPAGRVLLDSLVVNAEAIIKAKPVVSFRTSTIGVWKACHRLASLLNGSDYCKELALRIPSQYEDKEASPVPGGLFLTRCLRLVAPSNDEQAAARSSLFQMKIAVFCLMIQWALGCKNAIREITSSINNLSVLVDVMNGADTSSVFSQLERQQLSGLSALLLGACLDFMKEFENSQKDQSLQAQVPAHLRAMDGADAKFQMTASQFLDMITKKVGLQKFTDTLVAFQQTTVFVACARAGKGQSSRTLLSYKAAYDEGEGDEPDQGMYLFPLYDKPFTVLCRELADKVQQKVIAIYTGSGGDPSAQGGTAISAYQDLIRMQDKQLHELEQKVKSLTAQLPKSGSGEPQVVSVEEHETQMSEVQKQHQDFVANLQSNFNQERHELETRVRQATDYAQQLETRLNGLTTAFEQLELEHHARGVELKKFQDKDAVNFDENSPPLSGRSSVMVKHLEEQLKAARSLQSELQQRVHQQEAEKQQLERTLTQEKNGRELAELRLHQEFEELRVSLEEKGEQLAEATQMLELLNAGQELVKKENEKLKEELEQLRSCSGGSERERDSAAMEQLRAEKDALQLELQAKENDFEQVRQYWQKKDAEASTSSQHSTSDTAGTGSWVNVDPATTQHEGMMSRVNQLTSNLQAMLAEKEAQASEASKLKDTLDKLDSELAKTKEQLEVKCRELEESKAELQRRDDASNMAQLERQHSEGSHNEELERLKSAMSDQLAQISELQLLLENMETLSKQSAEEREAKDKELAALKQTVAALDVKLMEAKHKASASLNELENELAKAFLEKKEADRKAKASLSMMEDELAKVYLEMEKYKAEGAELLEQLRSSSSNQGGAQRPHANGNHAKHPDLADMTDESLDDMFVLLASLEIHCDTLRECLEVVQGEEAVAAAIELSRTRGAVAL
ncbi:TPA: hypothetical protein N0F65_007677 [Lagenidium giganteum]|uniref:Vesicle tethering protein Uso1/P115-like head domain-containing protein n=1 Tax=Lagenidium giganteum TaxID=4803 RepID=A0AAV2Z9E3_9STRA|nr:TPA: hypothetical protein N0F65_007677 [Lagenidium giganteum]